MANLYISQQLKAARKAANLTQRDVYEWLGVGQSTFSAWETGQSEPAIGVFLKLCQKYGIRDIGGYFIPETAQPDGISSVSPDFLNKLLSLSPRGREAVENCLDFEYRISKQKRIPFCNPRQIPLYTQTATAGRGSFLDGTDADLCELDAPEDADFAIRISGDSMEPLIANQQIVYVRKQQELRPGEIGIFLYNGESYCKLWENRSGSPKLVSLNPDYKPILLSHSDDLVVCGKVLL